MMRLWRPWTEPWKAQQRRLKRFPPEIQARALVKMMMIDSAEVVSDLSTDMALRLSKLFGTSERFWINLQANIDVRNRKPEMEPELEKIHPIRVTA